MSGFLAPNADHAGFAAGFVYPLYRGGTGAVAVAAVDTIYFYPFTLPRPMAFDRGYIYVTVAGAGSSVKSAIWGSSPTSQVPVGAPLYADNAGAVTTGTGKITLALGSGLLVPGVRYWFGTKFTGTLPTVAVSNAGQYEAPWLAGWADAVTDLRFTTRSLADAYANDMPTIAEGASFVNAAASVPLMWLRAA